jgi:hypothetical protein
MPSLSCLITLFGLLTFSAQTPSDEAAIRQIILHPYVECTQNAGPLEDIRKGFHPDFTMYRLVDNQVVKLPLEEWISAIAKRRESGTSLPHTTARILSIDITGDAALAKVELWRDDKRIFTDYLSFYRFKEGWRMVAKTYHLH